MEHKDRTTCCEEHLIQNLLNNIPEKPNTKALKDLLAYTMTVYSKRASRQMVYYYITKVVSFVAPLVITVLTSLAVLHANTYTIILSLVASLAVGIAGIGMFHDNWIRYRECLKTLTNEVVQYAIGKGDYDDLSADDKFGKFSSKVFSILNAEKDEWKKKASVEYEIPAGLMRMDKKLQGKVNEMIQRAKSDHPEG